MNWLTLFLAGVIVGMIIEYLVQRSVFKDLQKKVMKLLAEVDGAGKS